MGMSSGVASPQVQAAPTNTYPQAQSNNNAMPNYYMNYYNSLMGNNSNSLSYYEAMLPYLQGYQNNTNVAQTDMGYGGGNNYGGGSMNTGMDSYYQHPQQPMGNTGLSGNQYGQNMMPSPSMINTNPPNNYGNASNYQTNYQQLASSLTNYPSQNKTLGGNNPINMQMPQPQNQNQNLAKGAYSNPTFLGYNTSANQIVQQDLMNNAQISTNYGSNTNVMGNNPNNNDLGRYGAAAGVNFYGVGGVLTHNNFEPNFDSNRLSNSK